MNALAKTDSPVLTDDAGLVRRFLAWTEHAGPAARAAAVSALARAYLYSNFTPATRAEAEIALTRTLDDPQPRVRHALAQALASAAEAPRHLVLALASDISEVSRPVLALSPLLRDADLVDCAGIGDAIAQTAIARRARLAAPVAAALAEIGEAAAALALIGNLSADMRAAGFWRLFERFGGNATFRARLVERPGLPASLRAAIAAATTADVSNFASGWLDQRRAERIARDGREQAFVAISADCDASALAELVSWLRVSQNLSVGLLTRALCGGDVALFAQSLADMSGLPLARVAGLLRDAHGQGFASLYSRAQMPAALLPAFRIAVASASQVPASPNVDYALTMRILRAVEAKDDPALAPMLAMLWRLAGEATRADAREFAAIEAMPALPASLVEAQLEAPPLSLNVEAVNENCAPPVVIDIFSKAVAVAA